MKILITITLILLSINSYSQRSASKVQTNEPDVTCVSNFLVVDGNLVWRKVFNKEIQINEYVKFVKLSSYLDYIDVSENDSLIIWKIKGRKIDIKDFKSGLSYFEILPYMNIFLLNGDVKIEIKSNIYRFTIFNIDLIADKTIAFWQKGEHEKLDTFYYEAFSKNKNVSDSFKQLSEPIFDKNFIDKFQHKKIKSDF